MMRSQNSKVRSLRQALHFCIAFGAAAFVVCAVPPPVNADAARTAVGGTVAAQRAHLVRCAGPDDVTLDFVAADINDVLKALALQTHTNIVSGRDVSGTVTVSLTHVTLDDALNMITRLSGYQYAKIGKTYVVGTAESIAGLASSGTATQPATTEVISFIYSSADTLTSTITQLVPSVKITSGKTATTANTGGVLIVTGSPNDLDMVKQIVSESEAALSRNIQTSQTVVYQIKYAEADDLENVLTRLMPNIIVTPGPVFGFTLQAPSTADAGGATSSTTNFGAAATGAPVTTTATNAPTKPATTTLLLTGSVEDIAKAKEMLAMIDTQPAQINYDAKVAEINLNSQKNLGLGYDFSGASTRIGELADNTAVPPPTLGDNGKTGRIAAFGTFARTAISDLVTVNLDMLFKGGDAKLLSNPNISALDGQPAAAFIGDTVYYVSSVTQGTTGPSVTTSSVNVGVKLFVTGRVNNDGWITLNVHPEVSEITSYLTVPGGGSLPQVSTREATTTIRVHDGDTVAIGGLISENDIKNMSKVPFLGDLPFFGQLFRDSQHQHTRDEVVIFLKVSLQKDPAK